MFPKWRHGADIPSTLIGGLKNLFFGESIWRMNRSLQYTGRVLNDFSEPDCQKRSDDISSVGEHVWIEKSSDFDPPGLSFTHHILIRLHVISTIYGAQCPGIIKEIFHMPEFGTAFSGMKADRKLTHSELVRAIRFMVAAEYEAIQIYVQLAESTDNELAKEVLMDIADEEKVHAGEFLRLLHELEPDEGKFYEEGAGEVEEEIAKMKK